MRFTHEMVPLGDPRQPQLFDIDCAEKGSGRWIDGRNWVYDFEQDLPAGIPIGRSPPAPTRTASPTSSSSRLRRWQGGERSAPNDEVRA